MFSSFVITMMLLVLWRDTHATALLLLTSVSWLILLMCIVLSAMK